MPRRKAVSSSPLALVFAAVAALACSDSLAPRAASEGVSDAALATITTGAPASGRKSSGGGRTSSGGGSIPTAAPDEAPTAAPAGAPLLMRFAAWAPPLATYDTSFAIVVGKASSHLVMFKNSPIPFLRLSIPANADFFGANGKAIGAGKTVSVSVSIDRVSAAVTFGPHGTLFKQQPAKLYLNYFFLDLAGRSPSTLSIWYQPTSAFAWLPQPTSLEVEFWWLVAPLYHFSNYAIAY